MFADQVDISMAQAVLITVFSMTTVFLALWAISYVIDLISCFFSPKKKKEKKEEASKEPQVIYVKEPVDEDEITAVIMAAIQQYERERLVNPIARNQEGSYKSWR